MLQPYSDSPSSVGLPTTPMESIAEISRLALETGVQLCVHAIGDRANRETLNVFERAYKSRPDLRDLRWRVAHLLLMGFIALQAWLGALCPLTTWEQALRRRAGQAAYAGSFIEHWLSRLIFFEGPWWAFVAAYSAFAALMVVEWVVVRPRHRIR
jgi:hypothetical protein